MKPKLEKNIFIKRIINNAQSLRAKKFIKSNLIKSSIDNNDIVLNSKNCYVKPHPIFIITNSSRNNSLGINLSQKNNKNFIYIKANNTERNKYLSRKRRLKNNLRKKEYNKDFDNIRSKSFENIQSENFEKIRKYFDDNSQRINNEYSLDKNLIKKINLLNNTNNKSRNKNNINNTNYLKYKFNSMNIIEERNLIKVKSSKSADIIKLCKVLKHLNYSVDNYDNKDIFINDEDSIRGIISLNKNLSYKKKEINKYLVNIENLIKIQKCWKKLYNKNYLNRRILFIQKIFRGYIFRKNFLNFLYKLQKFSNPEYLCKIIFIQIFWKKYLLDSKQKNISFSYSNTEENNTNKKDMIYIDNINSSHKKELNTSKNKNKDNSSLDLLNTTNNYYLINRPLNKTCFFTKKYYSKLATIFSNITLIQNNIRKFMEFKRNNNLNENKAVNILYQKKIFKNIDNIDNNRENKNNKFKSLIIVSPEKDNQKFSFSTPKKDKNKSFKLEDIIIKKPELDNILNKQINKICFITRARKKVNLIQRIKFLQKYFIKLFKNKKNYYKISILKDRKNVCIISKVSNIITKEMKCKILFLQMKMKKFLKSNELINKTYNDGISNPKTIKKNKDLLSSEQIQSTNDISNKKIEEKSRNKNIIISEFSPNSNTNKEDENENFIISDNLNIFSFDFKNNKEENVEDDDSMNIANIKVENNDKIINFSFKNIFINNERYYSYKKLKLIFITNITNKFTYFLTNILNKLHLYNFLKLLLQKINKSIHQFTFYHLFDKKKEKYEISFFTILKRHIKFNIEYKEDNEIKNLLIGNIPKCFDYNNENVFNLNIPYINNIQENNLINTQLFINRENDLINYFINFYINAKRNFSLNPTLLKNILITYKLKDQNLFTLTNYFDEKIELIKNNKLCKKCFSVIESCFCNNSYKRPKYNYIKKKCNYISMITKKKKENINDEYFNTFKKDEEDDINIDEFNENDKFFYNQTLNNSHAIEIRRQKFNNMFNYHNENTQKNYQYKFMDYINEKCKNNKYNETLPLTFRSDIHSFRNNKFL